MRAVSLGKKLSIILLELAFFKKSTDFPTEGMSLFVINYSEFLRGEYETVFEFKTMGLGAFVLAHGADLDRACHGQHVKWCTCNGSAFASDGRVFGAIALYNLDDYAFADDLSAGAVHSLVTPQSTLFWRGEFSLCAFAFGALSGGYGRIAGDMERVLAFEYFHGLAGFLYHGSLGAHLQ